MLHAFDFHTGRFFHDRTFAEFFPLGSEYLTWHALVTVALTPWLNNEPELTPLYFLHTSTLDPAGILILTMFDLPFQFDALT